MLEFLFSFFFFWPAFLYFLLFLIGRKKFFFFFFWNLLKGEAACSIAGWVSASSYSCNWEARFHGVCRISSLSQEDLEWDRNGSLLVPQPTYSKL